jgi:hypothetical protein
LRIPIAAAVGANRANRAGSPFFRLARRLLKARGTVSHGVFLMNNTLQFPLRRLAFALALGLCTASLVAVAAEPVAGDTTEVEISNHGVTERVVLVDLAVGESRQLYSEAGTLVTATRTADALELDIAGDRTHVAMPSHTLSDDAIAALVEDVRASGDEKSKTRIVRVHRTGAGDASTVDVVGDARVLVLKRGDGTQAIDADGIDLLLNDADGSDGKRVIVKRTVSDTDARK